MHKCNCVGVGVVAFASPTTTTMDTIMPTVLAKHSTFGPLLHSLGRHETLFAKLTTTAAAAAAAAAAGLERESHGATATTTTNKLRVNKRASCKTTSKEPLHNIQEESAWRCW